jgi:LacI family transcriptional regulator, gluconate utilization system Gnt-I transcriptional repressor
VTLKRRVARVIVTNPIQTSTSSRANDPRRRGHGRVTLADVAAQAGVTTMTVSRFLRSPQRVASATAEQIRLALLDTGYSPNLQAGSLASGRSQAVAVIVPNIAHSIFADTLHGLGARLQAQGLHMMVSSTGYSLALEEQHVRTMLGWAPAAIVLTGRIHLPETQRLLHQAHQRGTPVVEIWDQSPADEPHAFQQIGFDHTQVGALMAQALAERGYRSLAFIDSGVAEDFRAHERAQGFLTKASQLGLPAQLLQCAAGEPVEQGGECFAKWYAQRNTSLNCGVGFANDLFATGALLMAQSFDCRMPEDIGLLGFGDFPAGRYCLGGLSTVHIDGERIGQMCADYIAGQLAVSSTDPALPHQLACQPRLLWRGA